jgi:CheY-like chemotaxis protein
MLRQTLLSVMTYALDMGFNGHMQVMTFAQGNETGLQIQVSHSAEVAEPARRPRQGVGLDLCEKLIWEMGGVLTVTSADAENWQARLVWPTAVSPLLLVIDDNAGLADLFQRFLAGTDWQVLRAAGGSEARAVIAAHRPGVITLDVKMPGEDGWELLMAFKQAESTRDIPIIICSVFNEPQLAQTLGAAAYLPKPVTRPALLQRLKPWQQVGASLSSAR